MLDRSEQNLFTPLDDEESELDTQQLPRVAEDPPAREPQRPGMLTGRLAAASGRVFRVLRLLGSIALLGLVLSRIGGCDTGGGGQHSRSIVRAGARSQAQPATPPRGSAPNSAARTGSRVSPRTVELAHGRALRPAPPRALVSAPEVGGAPAAPRRVAPAPAPVVPAAPAGGASSYTVSPPAVAPRERGEEFGFER